MRHNSSSTESKEVNAHIVRATEVLIEINIRTAQGEISEADARKMIFLLVNNDEHETELFGDRHVQELLALREKYDVRQIIANLAVKTAEFLTEKDDDLAKKFAALGKSVSAQLDKQADSIPPSTPVQEISIGLRWAVQTLREFDSKTPQGFSSVDEIHKLIRIVVDNPTKKTPLVKDPHVRELLTLRGENDVRRTIASLAHKAAAYLTEKKDELSHKFIALERAITSQLEHVEQVQRTADLATTVDDQARAKLVNVTSQLKQFKGYIPPFANDSQSMNPHAQTSLHSSSRSHSHEGAKHHSEPHYRIKYKRIITVKHASAPNLHHTSKIQK